MAAARRDAAVEVAIHTAMGMRTVTHTHTAMQDIATTTTTTITTIMAAIAMRMVIITTTTRQKQVR
jgi:hypothetical protein